MLLPKSVGSSLSYTCKFSIYSFFFFKYSLLHHFFLFSLSDSNCTYTRPFDNVYRSLQICFFSSFFLISLLSVLHIGSFLLNYFKVH